jgi:hypothetical protein
MTEPRGGDVRLTGLVAFLLLKRRPDGFTAEDAEYARRAQRSEETGRCAFSSSTRLRILSGVDR